MAVTVRNYAYDRMTHRAVIVRRFRGGGAGDMFFYRTTGDRHDGFKLQS